MGWYTRDEVYRSKFYIPNLDEQCTESLSNPITHSIYLYTPGPYPDVSTDTATNVPANTTFISRNGPITSTTRDKQVAVEEVSIVKLAV